MEMDRGQVRFLHLSQRSARFTILERQKSDEQLASDLDLIDSKKPKRGQFLNEEDQNVEQRTQGLFLSFRLH